MRALSRRAAMLVLAGGTAAGCAHRRLRSGARTMRYVAARTEGDGERVVDGYDGGTRARLEAVVGAIDGAALRAAMERGLLTAGRPYLPFDARRPDDLTHAGTTPDGSLTGHVDRAGIRLAGRGWAELFVQGRLVLTGTAAGLLWDEPAAATSRGGLDLTSAEGATGAGPVIRFASLGAAPFLATPPLPVFRADRLAEEIAGLAYWAATRAVERLRTAYGG